MDALSVRDYHRVDSDIQALADNPRPEGVKKLKGSGDLYRIRSGVFRIIYQIEDIRLIVLIVKVGDRKDIYRGL